MINHLHRTDLTLDTEVTIDGKTERFSSSPKTLRTNVYVTLALSRLEKDICVRLEKALLSASGMSFFFEEGNLRVSATLAPVAIKDKAAPTATLEQMVA